MKFVKQQSSILGQPKTMAAVRITLSLLLFPTVTSAGESCKNVYSQSGYALIDNAYESFLLVAWRRATCLVTFNQLVKV